MKLFGTAVVKGRVRPAKLKVRPVVRVRNNGKVVRSRVVSTRKDGRFRAAFSITKPGSYRAEVLVKGAGVKRTLRKTGSHRTSTPALSRGARGGDVKRLEKRLRSLGYYIPKADRYFGTETADALIAFHKVQRTSRMSHVTATTWHKLARPIRPRPRYRSARHFEVDQTRQVVFIVEGKKVKWILHTSTGAGGATRDGTFTVHRKLAGYSPGRLYYPSYWDGLRAFHGWPEVPTYPASHGCARIPMWSAQWMYGQVDMGDTVYVYH